MQYPSIANVSLLVSTLYAQMIGTKKFAILFTNQWTCSTPMTRLNQIMPLVTMLKCSWKSINLLNWSCIIEFAANIRGVCENLWDEPIIDGRDLGFEHKHANACVKTRKMSCSCCLGRGRRVSNISFNILVWVDLRVVNEERKVLVALA